MKAKVINPVTGIEIDKRTLSEYTRRGEQFLRQFALSKGIDSEDSHQYIPFLDSFVASDFCDWFTAKKSEISRGVWRQYKACACIVLHRLLSEGHKGVTRKDLERMINTGSIGAKKNGEKTSSKKKKGFTKAEQKAVEGYLLKAVQGDKKAGINKLHYAQALYDLIHGNLHTGLRPQEYAYAFLEGTELIVKNAKYSQGRAHGEKRTIHLDDLSLDVVESIQRTLDRFRSTYFDAWERKCIEMAEALFEEKNPVAHDLGKEEVRKKVEDYAIQIIFLDGESLPKETLIKAHIELEKISQKPVGKLYKALQGNMTKVARRVFSKRVKSPRPTIYSTRHQVTANLKKAKVAKEEIAAVMGHKIVRTHQLHYARMNVGEDADGLVKGNSADIARVRGFSQERDTRIEKNKIKARYR